MKFEKHFLEIHIISVVKLKYIISIMINVHVNITTFSQSSPMYGHSHRLAVTTGELYVSVNMIDHMSSEHR